MKIVNINNSLKINIEQIYSIEKTDNLKEINNWKNEYKNYIEEYSKNPITLQISDNKVFAPEFGKENNKDDVKLYMVALHHHILSIIGEQPQLIENYYILLITGLKINISKDIYEKINNVFENFLV